MQATIRRAREADAAAIADVHVRSWRAGYRGLLPDELLDSLSTERRERSWGEIVAGGTRIATTIVAEEAGRVVGFCALALEPRALEIAALYVDPERWRRGIGLALLDAALADARERECRSAFLWVLPENEPARELYARRGFADDGGRKLEEGTGHRVIRLRAAVDPVPE